jgi:predicted ribosome quality control (RQC) complex YloA/Tae2 family protein
MNKDDIYFHADFHGSATTIVKNPYPDTPVPILTLEEAACNLYKIFINYFY